MATCDEDDAIERDYSHVDPAGQIELDRQELAARHSRMRRRDEVACLLLFAFILVVGAIGWWIMDEAIWMAICVLLSAIPLLMLLYTHLYIFSPSADPETVQRRLDRRTRRIRAGHARQTLLTGAMFVFMSPILLCIGVGTGYEESGVWGAAIGTLAGLLWFALGIGAILWSRQM